MWVRCAFTVASVIPSRLAASRLLSPSTTRCTISCSRALSRSRKAGFPPPGWTGRAANSETVRATPRLLAHSPWWTTRIALRRFSTVALLGRIPANPRLQGFDGPPFVPIGAGQDDPWPHPIQAKLTADLEGSRDLRVHEEDLGNAAAQLFPPGGRRNLSHHEERTIRAEEATQAGPEQHAVTQERDADRRGRNGRGGSTQRRPPGRPP